MKKVILHIGAGKTGTSALQSLFAINRNILNKYGYFYPEYNNDEKAKKFNVTSGNGIVLGKTLSSKKCNKSDIENVFLSSIENSDNNDILISSELIQLFNPDCAKIYRDVAETHGYRVVIVYYVRAIADHIVSLYHQKVKRHRYHGGLDRLTEKKSNQFLKTIKLCESIFDRENLIIKNYDYVKDNIFQDFLSDVLSIDNTGEFKIHKKRVNRSLTMQEIQIMKLMNKFFDSDLQSTFVSNALINNKSNAKYNMFISERNLKKLENLYGEDIKTINEYLKEDERPYSLSHSLQVVENEKEIKINPIHESILVILSELIKREIK